VIQDKVPTPPNQHSVPFWCSSSFPPREAGGISSVLFFEIEKSNLARAGGRLSAIARCDGYARRGWCWVRAALPALGVIVTCAGLLHSSTKGMSRRASGFLPRSYVWSGGSDG
jgi:hypothetical protein